VLKGTAGKLPKRFEGDDKMLSRKDMQEEIYLRKAIRESVAKKFARKDKEVLQKLINEMEIRKAVKKMVAEDVENSPHKNTGINELEKLLKKIIPVLEQDFKTLTSSQEQRSSFRAHIVKAVQNLLLPEIGMEKGELREETEVVVGDDDTEDEEILNKFIDIYGKTKPDITTSGGKKQDADSFGISGEDETGRNFAMVTFQKIEKNILDSYKLLADPSDSNLFYDYLTANLKLYFNRFEDELSTTVEEPTNPEYDEAEKEVSSSDIGLGSAGEEDAELGDLDLDDLSAEPAAEEEPELDIDNL